MRSFSVSFLLIVLVCGVVDAQFKSGIRQEPSVSESLVRPNDSGLMFGLFDPSKLTMRNSYSLSYSSFGNQGVALGVFTNSLAYKFSDALSMQTDISVMHSPYNSLGDKYGKSLSGIYLSRAELNYKPSENTLFQIQFRQMPNSFLYGGYGSPYWGLNRFE
jgi:hypothetical protein